MQAWPGVEWVRGDLSDPASIEAALEGVEHVFHLARSNASTWQDHLQRDVEPTRHLARLCAQRGISLSYTSSIAIYDGGRASERITETTPPSQASIRLNLYARAKWAAECDLLQQHREQGLKVVIFRPGIVLGVGGTLQHPGVGAWRSPALCRPWGGGHHPLPFVLASDCADALARSLRRPELAGQSFNLVGDAQLSGQAYLDALEVATGSPIRRQPLSAGRLFVQSLVKWPVKMLLRHPDGAWPSYRYVDGLSCRATYAADRAKQHLGWAPTADLELLLQEGVHRPARLALAGSGAVL